MGGNYVSSITYLYESAPIKMRGSYLNFYHFMLSTGFMIAFFANQMITISNWNLVLSIGVIFAILQVIVIGMWFDETPEYLFSLGEEA